MAATSFRNPKPRARAMSWMACWNTVVMKSLSQCLPQPAVWGRYPQPKRDGGQGQKDVYQREAQHHLDDHVEDEEAVDQVEDRQEQRHADAARLATAVIRECRKVDRSMSPAVTLRETAMNPDTASATSRTRAHHHREDAAATRPSTRRGTISRQPA